MADRSPFDQLHASAKAAWDTLQDSDKTVITVNIHGGSLPVGAEDIYKNLIFQTETRQIPVIVRKTGSLGFEFAETIVQIKRPGEPTIVYGHINEDDVIELIERAVIGGVWAEKALGWLEPEGLVVEPPMTLEQSADAAGLTGLQGDSAAEAASLPPPTDPLALSPLGADRPGEYRGIYRRGRLPGLRQGPGRDDARSGDRRGQEDQYPRARRRGLPDGDQVGVRAADRAITRNMSSATATRASRTSSRTAAPSRATPTSSSKGS